MKNPNTIDIEPALEIDHFRSNGMKLNDLLKELVDNSVQQMVDDPKSDRVDVNIVISGYDAQNKLNREKASITVSDNGKGIEPSRLKEALSAGNTKSRNKSREASLNEHGVGLKIAAWNLGDEVQISTKTKDQPIGIIVPRLPMKGKVKLIRDTKTFKKGRSGTSITVSKLRSQGILDSSGKNAISTTKEAIKNISQLGCIYADYVYALGRNGKKKLSLTLELKNETGETIEVHRINPEFRHFSGKQEPAAKVLKPSKNCEASLVFGLAASDEELDHSGVAKYPAKHPFHKWNRTISIIHNGRVLKYAALEEFGLSSYFTHVPAHGALRLLEGFPTNLFKDGLAQSDNWVALKPMVEKELREKFSEFSHYSDPDACVSEKDVQKQLAKRWEAEGLKIKEYYPVETCGGFVDIMRAQDEEGLFLPCELKIEQADSQDLFQCLMYRTFGPEWMRKDVFWLIAPSFSQCCINTAKEFKNRFGLDIKLKTFDELGIKFSEKKKKKNSIQKSILKNVYGSEESSAY
jgi:hypothetical protein